MSMHVSLSPGGEGAGVRGGTFQLANRAVLHIAALSPEDRGESSEGGPTSPPTTDVDAEETPRA
jgi:hypothetical protein